MGHMTTRVRLSPEERREQLLELGAELLAQRTLDEMSIEVLADAAGISRGLLYHYFGTKQEFHEAVVRRVMEHLIEATAPVDHPDAAVRMTVSLHNFVAHVRANHPSYLSFRKAAHGGNEAMRAIYDEARSALIDRIFDVATPEEVAALGVTDSPAVRMLTHAWGALVEDAVLAWLDDDRGLTEDQLVEALVVALPGTLAGLPKT